jgi:hypothetical protein
MPQLKFGLQFYDFVKIGHVEKWMRKKFTKEVSIGKYLIFGANLN